MFLEHRDKKIYYGICKINRRREKERTKQS